MGVQSDSGVQTDAGTLYWNISNPTISKPLFELIANLQIHSYLIEAMGPIGPTELNRGQ